MNIRSLIVALCLVSTALCPSSFAQKKYKDPYHPKVKAIATKAVGFLESQSGGDIGQQSIAALACIEYYKRYDGAVPTDVPMIEQTVATVAGMVNGNDNSIYANRESYFPALALILLAEYDSKKYEDECIKVLGALIDRQISNGAFAYKNEDVGDTSQSQFGALAFFVARQHRLPLDPKHVKSLLAFYVDYQGGNGTWAYKPRTGGGNVSGTNSLHSASLSSVYLLADMLRLSPRVKDMSKTTIDTSLNLPKNVTVYVPPKDDEQAKLAEAWGDGDGPVVQFERGKLSSCKNAGNAWYQNNYELPIDLWNSYFMYALERYCYFKEQAEGNLGSTFSTWYDDGVDYIEQYQKENGDIEGHRRFATMGTASTALYTLFLVRASEIISLPPVGGDLNGGLGFQQGQLTQGKDGQFVSSEAEKSLQEMISQLADNSLDERQLRQMTEAMKRSVREFGQSGEKSRGEVTAFLKTMISEKNYYRRLIAIRFLAAEQDMDNVPALLYAMGDPDPTIAIQAHNGLRLISRKFDTFVFEDTGNKEDNLLALQRLKRQWTKWYLEIRPDAELLE